MVARTEKLLKTSYSRVFTQEGGAGPNNPPVYQGLARATGVAWPQGDISPIRVPSRDKYDRFDVATTIQGQQGLPSLSLEFRMQQTLSDVLRFVKKGCEIDVHVHIGACQKPDDFNGGWADGKAIVLSQAQPTDYTTDDLGALDSDQRAIVMETVPFTGLDYNEIAPIKPEEQAASIISDEIVGIKICDSIACGECGLPSDGCQVIFALQAESSGSPGISAAVLYSVDGGSNWTKSLVSSLPIGQDATAIACVGTRLVVVSNSDLSLHWADIADVVAGVGVWTRVATGFVASKGPNYIFSASATETWIVGNGGYVYTTADPTAGVEVQSSGGATVQNLLYIHGIDQNSLVAVGVSNAVLVTSNGGETWSLVTGPDAGVQLNTVAMKSSQVFLIGTDAGKMWYTLNGGDTWVAKAFSGTGSGKVKDIVFANKNVGYMAHSTTAPAGRMFRTIDGGYSWYLLPEQAGVSFPTIDRINAIAACESDVNVVFGGGLNADGADGVIVKVA